MSFDDDARDTEPPVPVVTCLLYRCARCSGLQTVERNDAARALVAAVESGRVWAVHDCDDGAQGVAQLIGDGPGRHPFEHHREVG